VIDPNASACAKTSLVLPYTYGDDSEPFDLAIAFVDLIHVDLTAAGLDLGSHRAPSRVDMYGTGANADSKVV
jgi:hypothetical protein